MTNQAADRWAEAQGDARSIVDGLSYYDGELISPWGSDDVGETQVECGEQTVAEIRRLLPDGWVADTDHEGLVLRRS